MSKRGQAIDSPPRSEEKSRAPSPSTESPGREPSSSTSAAAPNVQHTGTRTTLHSFIKELTACPSSSTASLAYSRQLLRQAYMSPLDRVNVLGDDEGYGHTGCVNALSWALDGDVLLSGGDDTTLRLWRLDPSDSETPYPYKEAAIIKTGHMGNIFNAHLLPASTRIATVAGDGQVRVFDAEHALAAQDRSTTYTERQTCIRVLKCHRKRTKRIIPEESSDVFLTVAEDGAVIQHDLRTEHRCDRQRTTCPSPLVKVPFDLSTLALSPLAPYVFVAAGESEHGYLFDRRQIGRTLEAEWGVPCDDESYVTCVRRFGRREEGPGPNHITGARMAQTNAHEVLLSYSGDAVYLYSTRDEPEEYISSSSVLPNNRKGRNGSKESSIQSRSSSDIHSGDECDEAFSELVDIEIDTMDEDAEDDTESSFDEHMQDVQHDIEKRFKAPIILPRRQFKGHCNVETVKDVNFIGVEDEYVASGSDDGNFFLWEKDSGRLHGLYEGDGSVVNVIESHPRLPLIACSGIDTTVKLFAPAHGHSAFSRMQKADQIMAQNQTSAAALSSSQQLLSLNSLLRLYRQQRAGIHGDEEDEDEDDDDDDVQTCRTQ